MRRVLVYAPRLLPASQTFVADQARALSRWTPTLVGRERLAGGIDVDDLVPPELRAGRGGQNPWRRTVERARRRSEVLRTVADRQAVDLVHAHFLTGGFDVVSTLRPLPCPVVVTAHGFDATWFGSPPATLRPDQWLHGWLRRRLLRQPVHFLAVSRFIRDELVRLGAPEERVLVHHTGVDTELFRPPAAGHPPRAGILVVARLVAKKGLFDLLEALRLLRAAGTVVPVEIIGEGPQRPAIERAVAQDGLDVTLVGARSRAEVLAAMQRAALLCSPSRTARTGDREGFGMVLAEAQATGLCVVASRSGGTVDAVADGRTGILVPEQDPRALAAALGRCLDDEGLRRSMGAAARPWVVENFDLRRQTAALEDLYDGWVNS